MLQNQTFMFFFIITFIIFLILYMWRKVASLESYVFILEKRLNLMKKDMLKNEMNDKYTAEKKCDGGACVFNNTNNTENTDIKLDDFIMNEVFGNKRMCNPDIIFENNINLPVANSFIKIMDEDEVKKEVKDEVKKEVKEEVKVDDKVKIEDYDDDDEDDDDDDEDEDDNETYENKNEKTKAKDDIEDVLNRVLDDKNIIFEEKKDIGVEQLSRQRLLKMPLSELKELCILHNISTDGTKPILINKLLSVNL